MRDDPPGDLDVVRGDHVAVPTNSPALTCKLQGDLLMIRGKASQRRGHPQSLPGAGFAAVPSGSGAHLSYPVDHDDARLGSGNDEDSVPEKDGCPRYLTCADHYLNGLTDSTSHAVAQTALCGMSGDFVAELPSSGMGLLGRVHRFHICEKRIDPIVHDRKLAAAKTDNQDLLHLSANYNHVVRFIY